VRQHNINAKIRFPLNALICRKNVTELTIATTGRTNPQIVLSMNAMVTITAPRYVSMTSQDIIASVGKDLNWLTIKRRAKILMSKNWFLFD
jgi:hypothetical protein